MHTLKQLLFATPKRLRIFAVLWFVGALCLLFYRWPVGAISVHLYSFTAGFLAVSLIVLSRSFAIALLYTCLGLMMIALNIAGLNFERLADYSLLPLFAAGLLFHCFSFIVLWSKESRAALLPSPEDWKAAIVAIMLAVVLHLGFFGLSVLITGPIVAFFAPPLVLSALAFVLVKQRMLQET